LDKLARKYRLDGDWAVYEAASLKNVFAKVMAFVDSASSAIRAPVLALEVYATAAASPADNETIAQSFEVHKAVLRGGTKALEQRVPRYYTVVPGDNLSKIAWKYYGNEFKWPVIYEANRPVIGKNPDMIQPGQRFLIPDLPVVRGMGGT
jgi:nucleoid-associated protein YgaU